jgi:hypothetical protein
MDGCLQLDGAISSTSQWIGEAGTNDRAKKDPIRTRWIAPGEDRRKEKEKSEVKKAW